MTQPTLARNRLRILILEDHMLFAESLDLVLTMEGYDVRRPSISEYGMSSAALLSAAIRLRPRIVLLDLDLGDMGDGVRLIGPLARAGATVVVVTASEDEGRWGQCLQQGARKVLSKSRPLNDVMSTVRRLNHGLPVMDVAERERLLAAWQQSRRAQESLHTRLDLLTGRERQVLGHLMSGNSVRDVSRHSVVSEATVRTQVKSILAKLEVSSQLAAVGLAHRVGWRPPSD
jgi:DNA-binding NarL/FixJ family response regulator